MDGGPPSFPRDFTCPVVLEMGVTSFVPARTGLSPSLVDRPRSFRESTNTRCQACTPDDTSHNPSYATRARLARSWFGQQPGSLATTSGRLLLPAATKMFQFAAFPPTEVGRTPTVCGVAPFGHSRLNAWLPLPYSFAADRRPSSAGRAEASSDRAFCLAWSLVCSAAQQSRCACAGSIRCRIGPARSSLAILPGHRKRYLSVCSKQYALGKVQGSQLTLAR